MIKTHFPAVALASLALFSVGCDDTQLSDAPRVTEAFGPQDAFWAALSSHCGKAYAGRLVSEDTVDRDFAEADMRMYVRECSDTQIAIPFHVRIDGEWDRSRTWLITRNDAGGLRLKHDHRHKDGEPDAVTMYGGDTSDAGSERAQSFPVDQESIELFEREGLGASVTNVWTMEADAAGFTGRCFCLPVAADQIGRGARRSLLPGGIRSRHRGRGTASSLGMGIVRATWLLNIQG